MGGGDGFGGLCTGKPCLMGRVTGYSLTDTS